MELGNSQWKILRCLRGNRIPGEVPCSLRLLAKKESGHIKINTSSKSYKAIWPERISDMVQSMAVDLDNRGPLRDLSKFFLGNFGTDQPPPRGI